MKKVKEFLGNPWGQRALILALIFIVMAIFQRRFFLPSNWANILLAIAMYGIMACGMLFVVLLGGMDLSVGSMAACAGAFLATNWVNGGYTLGGFFKGVFLALLAGVIVGMLHGVLVAYLNLPAFVVTLATKNLIYGFVIFYTAGAFIYPQRQEGFDIFYSLGSARVLGLTMPVWVFIAVVIVTGFVLSKTTFGRRLYAVGGSPRAAELVGIKTKRSIIIAFIFSSVCAAISGMVLVAMNMVAGSTTASGYEGDTLMAMIVGGINLAGGEGNIGGAVFGALLVGILNNIMNLLGVPSDYVKAIRGIIIIAALTLNVYTSRKSAGIISPRKARKMAAAAARADDGKSGDAAAV